ncbi:MAG: hypothetical protein HZB46_19035, partial [Solirubrobacterales bacterium]|nr:hypothetical protein [Solirubrobacterales bacterium]
PGPGGPATIGDRVWRDTDDDGVQDAGEPGEAGVAVELWDEAMATKLAATTTDGSGAWVLAPPSTTTPYRVRLVLPAGAIYAKADAGGDDATDSDVRAAGDDAGFTAPLTVAAATTAVDAGIVFRPRVLLGNLVWRDGNHDGIYALGEPVRPGVAVEAWNASRTQLLASATSDAGGVYALEVPRGGTYRVHFADATYPSFTPQDAGADDSVDSDVAAFGADFGWTAPVTPAANLFTVDAGVVAPINVGNFVWRDTNGNGAQDGGEAGVPGVTVQLWDAAKAIQYSSAVTNGSGIYTLRAPHAGTYRVRVLAPAGFTFTAKDAAGDNLTDSDINPSGPDAGYSDAFSLASNVISTTTWDAGLIPL